MVKKRATTYARYDEDELAKTQFRRDAEKLVPAQFRRDPCDDACLSYCGGIENADCEFECCQDF